MSDIITTTAGLRVFAGICLLFGFLVGFMVGVGMSERWQ